MGDNPPAFELQESGGSSKVNPTGETSIIRGTASVPGKDFADDSGCANSLGKTPEACGTADTGTGGSSQSTEEDKKEKVPWSGIAVGIYLFVALSIPVCWFASAPLCTLFWLGLGMVAIVYSLRCENLGREGCACHGCQGPDFCEISCGVLFFIIALLTAHGTIVWIPAVSKIPSNSTTNITSTMPSYSTTAFTVLTTTTHEYSYAMGFSQVSAGKILSHAPYKNNDNMYAKADFTPEEAAVTKKYDGEFLYLEPKSEYIINNIDNGLYQR